MFYHTYGILSHLSVSSWKCGFLRKTMTHSSCFLRQDKSTKFSNVLENPLMTTGPSGGDLIEGQLAFFSPCFQPLLVKFILQDGGGGRAGEGRASMDLGRKRGTGGRRTQAAMPQAPCRSRSSLDKNHPQQKLLAWPQILWDEYQFKISYKTCKEISHCEWKPQTANHRISSSGTPIIGMFLYRL